MTLGLGGVCIGSIFAIFFALLVRLLRVELTKDRPQRSTSRRGLNAAEEWKARSAAAAAEERRRMQQKEAVLRARTEHNLLRAPKGDVLMNDILGTAPYRRPRPNPNLVPRESMHGAVVNQRV